MSESLKVLSVQQPFADDIIFGDKEIEYRSWKTDYRGPLWIHASRLDRQSEDDPPGDRVCGAIIGKVDLVACFSREDLSFVIDRMNDVSGDMQCLLDTLNDLQYLVDSPVEPGEGWKEAEERAEWARELEEVKVEIEDQKESDKHRKRDIPPRLQAVADWYSRQTGGRVNVGEFNWLLANPRALTEPIRMPGKLRIWTAEVESSQIRLVDPHSLLQT